MTALAIASSTSTTLTVITPRAALCVGGQLSWLRMPSADTPSAHSTSAPPQM